MREGTPSGELPSVVCFAPNRYSSINTPYLLLLRQESFTGQIPSCLYICNASSGMNHLLFLLFFWLFMYFFIAISPPKKEKS